ncbi:MAG: tetratricopeptide repeat protein, partial [Kamptonema sp. SIO4C4]|nr:tetratricopeptide repeat protein [Kamptonema sp. SIO4C4]
SPDDSQLQELSHPYGNHPLALHLLLQTIQDDWEGNITAFLKQNTLTLANLIESYLKKQHSNLSETSHKILTALAVQTQPLTLTDIQRYFTSLDELQELPELLQELATQTLVENNTPETYTLHPNLRNPITQIFIAKQLNQRGYKQYCQGDLNTAQQSLLHSLDYQPDFPHAHYNLGSTYEQLGEIDEARKQYQLAANSHSKATHAAINNLSRLEILEGNLQAAIEQILAILPNVSKTGIQASLYKNLGWAYLTQNDYQTALTYLQTALELDEKKATTHFLYAQTLEALNQLTEAQTYWQNGLNYLPAPSQFGIMWRPPELIAWRVLAYQRLQTVSPSKRKKS